MTLKDILEVGFGIDFNSLKFEVKEGQADLTAEEVKQKLERLELEFNPETDCTAHDFIPIVDIDVWGDTISLYDE